MIPFLFTVGSSENLPLSALSSFTREGLNPGQSVRCPVGPLHIYAEGPASGRWSLFWSLRAISAEPFAARPGS